MYKFIDLNDSPPVNIFKNRFNTIHLLKFQVRFIFMFKKLFSGGPKKHILTDTHLKKCRQFIQYLYSKTRVDHIIIQGEGFIEGGFAIPVLQFQPNGKAVFQYAVSCFIDSIGQSRLSDYDDALQHSKYFFIIDPEHDKIAAHLTKLNVHFLKGRLDPDPASPVVLIGGTDINYKEPVRKLKVAALIHVHNESDMLGETIQFLINQGVHVHIVDNWSTDGSWEIVNSFPIMQVSRERFPTEGPSDHYEWYKQCEYSEQLSKQLDFDWFIHYDSDELRYSPWKNISLQQAISFIDGLGYNAIDFTVLDFRYTPDKEEVVSNFEQQNTWFEFGKRPGHFLQVKGWKKQEQTIDLKSSGGHHIEFEGKKIYPIKFLNKHYSLRSKNQAHKKLVQQRLPRTQKEKSERGWHTHIELMIEQQTQGWNKNDLLEWKEDSFQRDYLIERISGVGILDLSK